LIFLVLATTTGWMNPLSAREWTDAQGRVLVRGEVFATNENTVVVQKPGGDLIGIRVDELSPEDQEFIRQHELERQRRETATAAADREPAVVQAPDPTAAQDAAPAALKAQVWTTRDGHELPGHAVGFGRQQIVINRVTRLIDVTGTAFTNLDPVSRFVVLQTVAELDDPTVQTERDLNQWLRRQGGQPRVFNIEGVMLRTEGGDKVLVPFFVFSEQDLSALRSGWEQWKHEQSRDTDRQREDFLMSVQAEQYQAERQLAEQRQARQIQMMQTELLAAATGVTTIWEVYLLPAAGTFGRPLSVMVSARTSLQAQQMAAARFPGYVVGPTRSVNR
jgi:hypothetical protein